MALWPIGPLDVEHHWNLQNWSRHTARNMVASRERDREPGAGSFQRARVLENRFLVTRRTHRDSALTVRGTALSHAKLDAA
eukprot:CAMPEP_0194538092 /NCGR_PEP_ID=MMETSP0253-20130528/77551_1 /TAXON_ID=2966 /ORGANISM="Noctiluca scintillans" /LENGTH=80 /DNA_ID=CAMNT_0039384167 /DNA_START=233 /DNA_END=476 /DNA_ORIENTATION=+